MDIMSSILGREIDAVVRDTDKPVVFRWVCEIYVNKEVYTPLKVLNIDFDENPETNFAPTIVVRVALAAGDYYKAILPNDSIVELSLKRYTVNSSYDTIDYSVPFIEKRYKATVYNKQDLATAGNIPSEISKELLNITDIVIVQFQLLSKAIEKLRVMTVGGVYRKSTVKDLLQTVLTNCLGQIDVSDESVPLGIDIAEPNNTRVQETYVIPHDTTVVDLPDYIQNHSGGIYSSGLGHFIKEDFWYIYPKYDIKQQGFSKHTMTVIRVPPDKLPMIEKTYRIQGDALTVLATSSADKFNASEENQLNHGNGTRFTNADNYLEDSVQVKDNKATISRGDRVNEFVGSQRDDRASIAYFANSKITSNAYAQYSEVTKRAGNLFTFTWENSNMDLVVPTMTVKILMLDNDNVVEMNGTLVAAHHLIFIQGSGAFSRSYITNSVLTVFINTVDVDDSQASNTAAPAP